MLESGSAAGIHPSTPTRTLMTHPLRTKAAIAALTGLGIVSVLAGCTATAAAAPSTGSGSASSDSSSGSKAPASNATYKDGEYTEQGTYNSPGGTELISVDLTIKSNAVSAVVVKTVKADPTAREYEELFEQGISKAIVGKKINELNVSRVGGSSLTSMGFNDALDKIRASAKN
jgi:hypothetical protein